MFTYDSNFDLNNPFYLYLLMKAKNNQHIFNHAIGYNPFLMQDDDSYGFDIINHVPYLNSPFVEHDFGIKDIWLQKWGASRQLGLNNVYANLAAQQQYELEAESLKIGLFSTGLQVGSLALGGWIGIPISMGIDYLTDKYKENIHKIYAQNQKVNILTSGLLGETGVDTGLSAKEVKSISRYIRKLAVDDDLFSADDIQDMMLKLTKTGFLNNVNSSQEFKKITRILKDRVKDLAEFLGETDPSKLLNDLAKYKSLGFNAKQSFDMIKSIKIASDLSGINKELIGQMIGLATSQENPLSIDRRLVAKQLTTQLYQINYLSRGPFQSHYLTNRKEYMNAYMTANQKAEVALNTQFGFDTNKDVYLAMVYAQKHKISLQKAFDIIQNMNTTQKSELVNKFSTEIKDFSRIFFDKNALATVVQENPEVGNLHIKRTPLQRLIDRAIEQLGGKATVEQIVSFLSLNGFNSREISAAVPLIENRLKFGNWKMLDLQTESAEFKKQTIDILNERIKYKQRHGLINTVGRWVRSAENFITEIFGGNTGEDLFSKEKLREMALKYKASDNNEYSLYFRSQNFKEITGAKTFKQYLKNLVTYGKKYKHPQLTDEKIEENLENVSDFADKTGLDKYFDKSFIRYSFKKEWLKENVSNPYQYFKHLYKEKYKMLKSDDMFSSFLNPSIEVFTQLRTPTKKVAEFLEEHPEYGQFISDKGLRGRFQVELMASLYNKDLLPDPTKTAKIMKAANLYFDLAKSGKQNQFEKELKKRNITLNEESIKTIKETYSAYADKTTQKSKLIEAAIKGDTEEFKAQLFKSYALDNTDIESLKREFKDLGVDEDFINILNKREFGNLSNIFKSRKEKEGLKTAEKFLGVLNSVNISKNVRSKIEKAIESGDKEALAEAIDLIKDKNAKYKVAKGALAFTQSMKEQDIDEDEWGKLFKIAKIDTRKKAWKNIENITHLLGIDYVSNEEKLKIIQKWSQSPIEALEEINKIRKAHHQSSLDLSDLDRIAKITSTQKLLGLKDKSTLSFMEKASQLDTKNLEVMQVTIQKEMLKEMSESRKLLKKIAES